MSHLMSHDSSHKSSDSPKGKSWLKSPNLMTRPFTICGMSDSNSSRLEGVELVPKSQFEESPRPYHTAYKNTDSSVSISVSSLLVSEICHLTLSDESYSLIRCINDSCIWMKNWITAESDSHELMIRTSTQLHHGQLRNDKSGALKKWIPHFIHVFLANTELWIFINNIFVNYISSSTYIVINFAKAIMIFHG